MAKARTGTISQRGENRWRLQVTPEPDPLTGQRKRLSETIVGTRRDADRALQHLTERAGARLAQETNTVASLLDAFMNTATLAATTRADWQSPLDRHVIDDIGTIPLNRLRARDCDEFYARLREIGLGPSRVRCAHVVLHRAVAQAVRWGLLTHNVVTAATRPEVPSVNIRPPDATEVRAAVAYFEVHHRPWNPDVVTARWTRHRKRFDLNHVRVHDLRHFVATELLTAASTSEPSPTGSATHAPPPPSTSTGPGSPPKTNTPPTTSKPSSDPSRLMRQISEAACSRRYSRRYGSAKST